MDKGRSSNPLCNIIVQHHIPFCLGFFQTEMVRRHIQKEFWRVQDVLEGLHKSNSSRGTDTAKHRGNPFELSWKYHAFSGNTSVLISATFPCLSLSCTVTSGASGSFSTNSPASPLSSVSLTSPLSPFSPVPGSQTSPTKQLGLEVSAGHTQLPVNPDPKPGKGSEFANPEECRLNPKPALTVPHFINEPKPRYRPKSYPARQASLHAQNMKRCSCDTHELFPQSHRASRDLKGSLGKLDTVKEEMEQIIKYATNFDQSVNRAKLGDQIVLLQVPCQDSKYAHEPSDPVHTYTGLRERTWFGSKLCRDEVEVGLKKGVYSDSYQFSHDGLRKPNSNRRFSVPESRGLFLLASHQIDDLSFHFGPDKNTSSDPCFGSISSEMKDHQLAPLLSCHTGRDTRPFSYPNNQGMASIAPVTCVVAHPDSLYNLSGENFRPMQTHLWRKQYCPLHSSIPEFPLLSVLCKTIRNIIFPRSKIFYCAIAKVIIMSFCWQFMVK